MKTERHKDGETERQKDRKTERQKKGVGWWEGGGQWHQDVLIIH